MSAAGQHQALYRQYRPARFCDVRGQEHVSRALRNAVREDRVGHAYLLSGPRGTGKTSTARILAMALNCTERSAEGEPCGQCESCRSIRTGTSADVHELDAASNRGVDDIRDLISKVSLGTPGLWKVYIIDEVHRLTTDASSALLKTLEEPPDHVVFVLATTDPQKVLTTIRSRCQCFELHLISGGTLEGLVRDINQAEGLGLSDEDLALVVRRGQGSARDTLSALDLAAAGGGLDDTGAAVGELLDGLGLKDPRAVLVATAKAINQGRDPRQLATDLLDALRDHFLAIQAPELLGLSMPGELSQRAGALGLAAIVKSIEAIGAAASEMRDSANPRVTLEVALVRLVAPRARRDIDAVLERLERVEQQLASGVVVPVDGPVVERAPVQALAPVAALPGPEAGTRSDTADEATEHLPEAADQEPAPAVHVEPACAPVQQLRAVPPAPSAPRPPAPGERRSLMDAFPGALQVG